MSDGKDKFYRNLKLSKQDWDIIKWLRDNKQKLINDKPKKEGGETDEKMES